MLSTLNRIYYIFTILYMPYFVYEESWILNAIAFTAFSIISVNIIIQILYIQPNNYLSLILWTLITSIFWLLFIDYWIWKSIVFIICFILLLYLIYLIFLKILWILLYKSMTNYKISINLLLLDNFFKFISLVISFFIATYILTLIK